jgi:hypothetical protein
MLDQESNQSVFLRDQRLFLSNNLSLEFLNSDSSDQICQVDITNLIELFFYLQRQEDTTNYQITVFQPDLLMQNVTFDKSNRLFIYFSNS